MRCAAPGSDTMCGTVLKLNAADMNAPEWYEWKRLL
jgi:hypothetical protein